MNIVLTELRTTMDVMPAWVASSYAISIAELQHQTTASCILPKVGSG
jgi:hypothetical protein